MNRLAILLVIGLLAGSGCSQSYVIRLNTGRELTAATKPKLKDGAYVYKDKSGKEQSVPEGRVSEIEPASAASKEKADFKPFRVK